MDRTNEFSARDIEDNKGIACWGYLGLLFVMPLFAAADSPFARFHANQGFVLMMAELVMAILVLAANMLASLGQVFVWLYLILAAMFYIGMIAAIVFGIVNTLKGRAKELPLIGRIRLLH